MLLRDRYKALNGREYTLWQPRVNDAAEHANVNIITEEDVADDDEPIEMSIDLDKAERMLGTEDDY